MGQLRTFFIAAIVLILFALQAGASEGDNDNGLLSGLQGIKIEGLHYLSYQSGESDGNNYSEFFIHRAYLTAKKSILPNLSSRITFDTNQDGEGDGEGDMEVRLKYAYAYFHWDETGFVTKPSIEFGMVHGVWLDFEEHVNYYRMREQMFVERTGIVNSADFGVTLSGLFGPEMNNEYKRTVNSKYAGRYGSFAVGFYNGGGYHAAERNNNKVIAGRLTLRPLPSRIPGLQISWYYSYGEGNQSGITSSTPDWWLYLSMFSYESRYLTLCGQYIVGEGNQSGNWAFEDDPSRAVKYLGVSGFAEIKAGDHWRGIGGFDFFMNDNDESDYFEEYARYYVGIGYDFGNRNILLIDYDVKEYEEDLPREHWLQVSFQVHY